MSEKFLKRAPWDRKVAWHPTKAGNKRPISPWIICLQPFHIFSHITYQSNKTKHKFWVKFNKISCSIVGHYKRFYIEINNSDYYIQPETIIELGSHLGIWFFWKIPICHKPKRNIPVFLKILPIQQTGQVKPKTIKLVIAASPLSTQH